MSQAFQRMMALVNHGYHARGAAAIASQEFGVAFEWLMHDYNAHTGSNQPTDRDLMGVAA